MSNPKPADRVQGHHRRHDLVVLQGERRKAHIAPRGLSPQVRKAWHAYWASDVSMVARDVALPAIRRMFEMYEDRERARAVVRSALVVKGSQGQPRLNPVAAYVQQLSNDILRLETELGLTPMASMRLGIAVGEAKMTAAELNRIASKEPDDDELLEDFTPAD